MAASAESLDVAARRDFRRRHGVATFHCRMHISNVLAVTCPFEILRALLQGGVGQSDVGLSTFLTRKGDKGPLWHGGCLE